MAERIGEVDEPIGVIVRVGRGVVVGIGDGNLPGGSPLLPT
jgi:hypothetical protein